MFKYHSIRHPLEPEFRPKVQEKGHMLSVKKLNLTGLRACARANVLVCMRSLARARVYVALALTCPYTCLCVENRIHD